MMRAQRDLRDDQYHECGNDQPQDVLSSSHNGPGHPPRPPLIASSLRLWANDEMASGYDESSAHDPDMLPTHGVITSFHNVSDRPATPARAPPAPRDAPGQP